MKFSIRSCQSSCTAPSYINLYIHFEKTVFVMDFFSFSYSNAACLELLLNCLNLVLCLKKKEVMLKDIATFSCCIFIIDFNFIDSVFKTFSAIKI